MTEKTSRMVPTYGYSGCRWHRSGPVGYRLVIYARDFESLPVDQRIDYLMLLLFEARCDSEYIWGSNITTLSDGFIGPEIIRSLDVPRIFPGIISRIANAQLSPNLDDGRHVTLNAFYLYMHKQHKAALSDYWREFMHALWHHREYLAIGVIERVKAGISQL
jgi:hypothetical protein